MYLTITNELRCVIILRCVVVWTALVIFQISYSTALRYVIILRCGVVWTALVIFQISYSTAPCGLSIVQNTTAPWKLKFTCCSAVQTVYTVWMVLQSSLILITYLLKLLYQLQNENIPDKIISSKKVFFILILLLHINQLITNIMAEDII